MMNTIKHLLIFAVATFLVVACGHKKQESTAPESNLTEITNQQFTTDSMQLGKMETRAFENTVKCNGNIVPLPDGMAKVNAPFRGIVKKIYCQHGQSVKKNQALLEISGNEIIDIQNEFAVASATSRRLKSEYERIKSLYEEKVTSEKDFILAETEFKAAMAKYNGLKLKIESVGFSVSKIENGEFYSFYTIKAPIAGVVSKLQINIGSYTDTQSELLEIINPEKFQVKLSVFTKDISHLEKGQSVRFKSVNPSEFHYGTLNSVGVVIDSETKSIDCYATIVNKEQTNPVANEFIEAEIITKMDTVTALPSHALIKDENDYFILILNKQESGRYLFNKVEVETGRQYKGFTEILKPKTDGQILINGIYNITL